MLAPLHSAALFFLLPKTRSASALVSHGNACFWLACGKIAESPSSIWEIEGLLPSSCWRPSSVWLCDWLYPCGEGEKKQNKKKKQPPQTCEQGPSVGSTVGPEQKASAELGALPWLRRRATAWWAAVRPMTATEYISTSISKEHDFSFGFCFMQGVLQ